MKNRFLRIYLINATIEIALIKLFVHVDNGQHLILTLLFGILTTAVVNTLVICGFHVTNLINIVTLSIEKIILLCAVLAIIPFMANEILLRFFNDLIFYDIVTPTTFSHLRYTWSEPYVLHLYVIAMLTVVLVICKIVKNYKKNGNTRNSFARYQRGRKNNYRNKREF